MPTVLRFGRLLVLLFWAGIGLGQRIKSAGQLIPGVYGGVYGTAVHKSEGSLVGRFVQKNDTVIGRLFILFHLVDKLLFLGDPEDLLCGVIFNPQPFRFRMGSAAVDCSVKGKKQ